ncbi:MAG: DUF1801 domain-containing protein [Bacteroidota bacterium]
MNPAEAYIVNQPEPYKSILLELQVLIEHLLPTAELKYKYKIPFYYYKGKPFCYLNASHKRKYVDVGIVKGGEITVHPSHLVTKDRKKMASLRYKNVKHINNTLFFDVIKQAASMY